MHAFGIRKRSVHRADADTVALRLRPYYIVGRSNGDEEWRTLATNRRVLMVAFHFPPQRGSSGIQRTLRFARYLPDFGWEPHVLSVHPRAYEATDYSEPLPPGITVHRAFALDAARHLAIGKRFPAFLARPDRWISWWLGAVPAGLRLIRRLRPDVIWSTYPIATAHAIGHTLARRSRLPWVADFRDPMAQDGYPADAATWRSFKRIETRAIAAARRSVFTTPGAAAQYRLRYPAYADRISVIENGYDDEMFYGLDRAPRQSPRAKRVLLHSGIVYPSERDPAALFAALQTLHTSGRIAPESFTLRFRAPVHGQMIGELASRFGVTALVDVAPPVPYRDALAEMMHADGLVVLQAANCNEQIPAKLYEYLRARRPIVGLADPAGDTARALARAGVDYIAALEDRDAITRTLARFLFDLDHDRASLPDPAQVERASRRERTAELAATLQLAID
jgi:glycosyltransferase involved in cell wall biosynthesis